MEARRAVPAAVEAPERGGPLAAAPQRVDGPPERHAGATDAVGAGQDRPSCVRSREQAAHASAMSGEARRATPSLPLVGVVSGIVRPPADALGRPGVPSFTRACARVQRQPRSATCARHSARTAARRRMVEVERI